MLIEKITKFCQELEIPNFKDLNELIILTGVLLTEEVGETIDGIESGDDEELVDGFGDVAFLAINGIYKVFRERGFEHDVATQKTITVLDRISNANLSKLHSDGKARWDEAGKVIKPEGWAPPIHGDLFNECN
jgi:NTP pyrophosphatase (non-canonical NTP hydrolase)